MQNQDKMLFKNVHRAKARAPLYKKKSFGNNGFATPAIKVSTSMQRRLSESTEEYKKVKKNCYEVIDYVEFSKNGRFSWECPQKHPKGNFQGRAKASILVESVRKNKIIQNFRKK